jgi:membrane-bound lytic murein transglycosylase D
VRRGDTLSRIAKKFRVRLSDLLGWNRLTKHSVIRPGQRLVMYVDNLSRAGI